VVYCIIADPGFFIFLNCLLQLVRKPSPPHLGGFLYGFKIAGEPAILIKMSKDKDYLTSFLFVLHSKIITAFSEVLQKSSCISLARIALYINS
jgi:hypothetical protein